MRLAALSLLLLVPIPVAADPLCAGVTMIARGGAFPVSPFCVEVPVATLCETQEVEVVGTGLLVIVEVCRPR